MLPEVSTATFTAKPFRKSIAHTITKDLILILLRLGDTCREATLFLRGYHRIANEPRWNIQKDGQCSDPMTPEL